MPEEEKKFWAIYTRRSKKDEKDSPEGTIQAQEHRCAEYLKHIDGGNVEYTVFCDDGITGLHSSAFEAIGFFSFRLYL